VLESKHGIKTWPYTRELLKLLNRSGVNAFAAKATFDDRDERLQRLGLHFLIARPMRELMTYLSFMDLVVGPDTGPMHIAAALNVPTLVVTREYLADLYEHYRDCQTVTTRSASKRALYTVLPRRVFRAALEVVDTSQRKVEGLAAYHLPRKMARNWQRKSVGLFRLDGLGGTITLTDHAKKIHARTGLKSVALVRGGADAFNGNPYIEDVVSFGYRKWHECLAEALDVFDVLAEIRFGIGKWHQREPIFEQDFADLQGMFDEFPHNYRELEVHGLHHVQVTDKILGLPFDGIEMSVYCDKAVSGLPEKYVAFANGVDAQHQGMQQTKIWYGWEELVKQMDVPLVQVGTVYDPKIRDAIDIRGKTTIPELFYVLKKADVVVCCEGGIMHVAYAVGQPNVVVIRGPTRGKLFEYPGHTFVDSYVCDNCWSTTPDWYVNCPRGIDRVCMKTISPLRVSYNLERLLNETLA
jgi:ADP-heptose:LPS heptosyltransferase